ncbi:MAG TPA: glycosyl hydrolase family 28-related protein [Terriglobales bacterium]|nr:glycosyl hydrolase family 28-related protein [Terriglobales bacterium]
MISIRSRKTGTCILRALVLVSLLSCSGFATVRDVTSFGATGDGSHDDTSAIQSAIAAMGSGDELFFPCGSAGIYKVSSLLRITAQNSTVDGATGCSGGRVTIRGSFSGGTLFLVGGGGTSSATGLTADAAELSTTFAANLSALGGVGAGDYVNLQEGGIDGASANTDPSTCDSAGPCRGEVLKVASASGSTAAIDTSVQTTPGLHFAFNTANGANVRKLLNVVSGCSIHDLTFDGSGTVQVGLSLQTVVDCALKNLTVQNFTGSAVNESEGYNNSWSSVSVNHGGGNGGGNGSAFNIQLHGHDQINGVTLSSLNLHGFGFFIGGGADSTIGNLTVDATGTTQARAVKANAEAYSTWNSLTERNGDPTYNGLSLEYYASHNTFNDCSITNNGPGGAQGKGINTFGNYNQFNTFNNCTVTGNGGWAFGQGQSALGSFQDSNTTINGGTWRSSNSADDVLHLASASTYVHNATIGGPGATGISLTGNNGCINSNIFLAGSGLSAGISVSGSGNVGSGSTLNGFSSNLPGGTCGSGSAGGGPPVPPTGLAAVVH